MKQLRRLLTARERGQSLVTIALILMFVVPLLLTGVEVGARFQERAQVEDALRQSARAGVQAFQYATFAADGSALAADTQRVTTISKGVLVTNLTGMLGLAEAPSALAERTQWVVLPGGSASASCFGITVRPPAVCARVTPMLNGLLGWGMWSPQLTVAVTLDRIDQPLP
jgi:Flp pilus assembly protein TadG